jgi:hypothetical protein
MNKLGVVILVAGLALAGCGKPLGTVEHDGDVRVYFDTTDLQKYFAINCREQLGQTAPDEQIQTCVDGAIADFLGAISQ